MVSLKNLNKVKANSIIESVVALCIISVCLYIAMLVFSAVLTQKSSPKFYQTQHKANALFYLSQIEFDSIINQTEAITIETTPVNANLKELTIKYKDSTEIEIEKKFYLLNHEE
ncbi:hypothetical protein B0A78_08425 [Flavobacterium columnare NBRC 100251 = ATCC 23463]|uniref:Type II secretion system protein n=2 Tax=Flavobacterium columnare TaxID=996 RepID=G8XBJ0_FLACA|nr:hypothetical protein [Flavobacterium columnare]AEW86770.1 hypothetical protein FCOL_09805 [Flavobacterium columnare ATCC 49512]AMO20650.1 hypothetical protein UN65_10165 [Flavobacterium columnare]APT22141.1 hypothetical protein BU993_05525 [Flavobacterium columnare]AUX18622.1 hypothetical protein AQ623_10315 [Flavobacterium columnare]MBF6652466.1 hypothetical protein [Flavobacterium columnare]